ncbi:MAG: hypothetical protein AB7L09_22120 [Nitrospira sp.]
MDIDQVSYCVLLSIYLLKIPHSVGLAHQASAIPVWLNFTHAAHPEVLIVGVGLTDDYQLVQVERQSVPANYFQ